MNASAPTPPSSRAAGSGLSALPWRYSATAIALHWLLAVWLCGMAAVGWYMMSVEDQPGSVVYFQLHKSFGLLLVVAVVARLAWRLGHRPAALPASVAAWQARLSLVVQGLLYALMLAIPLSGYLGASHSKSGVQLFGIETPRWALPDHDRAEQFFGIHGLLVWVLVAAVVLHLLGALKHLLVDRDGVFQRMWFKAGKR